MTVKATGSHFDFVIFVFKVERGRRGGRERMVSFCNALLLLEYRWEAEAQDPMDRQSGTFLCNLREKE